MRSPANLGDGKRRLQIAQHEADKSRQAPILGGKAMARDNPFTCVPGRRAYVIHCRCHSRRQRRAIGSLDQCEDHVHGGKAARTRQKPSLEKERIVDQLGITDFLMEWCHHLPVRGDARAS